MSVVFFKQQTAYEMRISDWSSDVCSSDLRVVPCCAGNVPIAARPEKARNLARDGSLRVIFLANRREILPMIGNGARNAVHRPVGDLPGRGRPRRPRGLARSPRAGHRRARHRQGTDRRATPPSVGALRSEEHKSELQSLMRISYAVFCLKKKKKNT